MAKLAVHVLAKLEPFKSWPEKLVSRYADVPDECTWIIVTATSHMVMRGASLR